MRIISGKYKGKKILGFDIDGTRPTMDRVKESVFAIIQSYIKDSVVLDLFAGSGNLGIEALSNGAGKCYFVDNNKIAIKAINNNLSNIENGIVIEKDCFKALEYFKDNNIKFNLIFLDPPYYKNLLNDVLNLIEDYNLLLDNGIIVCEYEIDEIITNLEIIKERSYGSKKVAVLKK